MRNSKKEMPAILFGCTRFKHYIYGRRTVVESGCKPIESIMKKPLCSAPPRLQRLMLQLQQYDIEVIHFRGISIPLGDALSRKYVSETFPNLIEGLDAHVHTVLVSLPVSVFVREKAETIVVYDLKLATDDLSDKKFLFTSKLCPLGAVCSLPRGYIHVLNQEKKTSSFLWMFSLLLKELISEFYLASLQLVLCRVAAVKRLPVHQP